MRTIKLVKTDAELVNPKFKNDYSVFLSIAGGKLAFFKPWVEGSSESGSGSGSGSNPEVITFDYVTIKEACYSNPVASEGGSHNVHIVVNTNEPYEDESMIATGVASGDLSNNYTEYFYFIDENDQMVLLDSSVIVTDANGEKYASDIKLTYTEGLGYKISGCLPLIASDDVYINLQLKNYHIYVYYMINGEDGCNRYWDKYFEYTAYPGITVSQSEETDVLNTNAVYVISPTGEGVKYETTIYASNNILNSDSEAGEEVYYNVDMGKRATYEIKNPSINIELTEEGFNISGTMPSNNVYIYLS